MTVAPGALRGVRVLDLTTVIMGPFATVTLADLGAEVIKVESPSGDMARGVGASRNSGMSALTLNLDRNKRSVTLDLGSTEGRAVLGDLIRTSDVLVTNLRPRSRAKLGLTYDALAADHPRLVVCTAQAYGSETARRDQPAYDDVVQADSGGARLQELVDGTPRFAPSVIADKVVGMYLVIAVLAAVLEQRRTGLGQAVDVPMVDSMIAFNLVEHLAGHTFDPIEGDFGWARALTPERTPHRTADGWICIMPYSLRNWDDFFTLAGRPDLAGDPRFADLNDRHRRMGELLSVVAAATPTRTTADWLALCDAHAIPAADLRDLAKAHEDDYIAQQELLVRREHPTEGGYFSTRTPLRFSRTPVVFDRHAPRAGQDTVAVLRELGYDHERVARLTAAPVVGQHLGQSR